MSEQDYEQLTLFQGDSLASLSVLPGSDEARKMTVTSGRKCLELYRRSGPLGSLVRMLLGLSVWSSTQCYLTWKASATPARRLLFRLVPLTPHIDGIDVRLWPTVTAQDFKHRGPNSRQQGLPEAVRMWPTPTAMDAKGLDRNLRKGATSTRSILLSQKVAMFPTPTARDFKSPDMNPDSKRFSQKTELPSAVGGAAQPGLGGMADGLPHWLDEPGGIPRIATGVKDRVNRLKCLGNAVVPQQFYPVFRAIAEIERIENHDR